MGAYYIRIKSSGEGNLHATGAAPLMTTDLNLDENPAAYRFTITAGTKGYRIQCVMMCFTRLNQEMINKIKGKVKTIIRNISGDVPRILSPD